METGEAGACYWDVISYHHSFEIIKRNETYHIVMELELSSKINCEYKSKIEKFKSHFGMFLGGTKEYNEVTAFLYGMDYAYEGKLLNGYSEWLNTRIGIGSVFGWQDQIKLAIEKKQNFKNYDPSDLTLDLLIEFLDLRKLP